tara:strand:+ start:159 stop:593 length:435 start_codon:yes stop_codon:yes gene_type:complete
MALSTWSADSSVWSGNSYIWDNNTYSATATLAGNGTFTSSQNAVYPVAVTMTQVILSELNEEDTIFPRSLSMGMTSGMTGSASHVMPVTATITGLTGDIKNNVNFPETATLSMNNSTSSASSFLWNDIEEDEDTLWTKISDPDN